VHSVRGKAAGNRFFIVENNISINRNIEKKDRLRQDTATRRPSPLILIGGSWTRMCKKESS